MNVLHDNRFSTQILILSVEKIIFLLLMMRKKHALLHLDVLLHLSDVTMILLYMIQTDVIQDVDH